LFQVQEDPLVQLPGFTKDVVNRLAKGSNAKSNQKVGSLRELRSLERKTAAAVLQKVMKGKNAIDSALDCLYGIPEFSVQEATVLHELEKTTGESRGKLKLVLDFNRDERGKQNKDTSYTLVLLVGSFRQRMLLADASLSVSSHGSGTWTVSKELQFDWSSANADGGEGEGQIVLRLLWEEIRGFDAEMVIPIK
jgi:hypothetical protein